jgi:hypothetical protein
MLTYSVKLGALRFKIFVAKLDAYSMAGLNIIRKNLLKGRPASKIFILIKQHKARIYLVLIKPSTLTTQNILSKSVVTF